MIAAPIEIDVDSQITETLKGGIAMGGVYQVKRGFLLAERRESGKNKKY